MDSESRNACEANPVHAAPEPMTSCACAGRSFAEVEYRMLRDSLSAAEAEGLTGCGSICTACIPDLRTFLGRRARP